MGKKYVEEFRKILKRLKAESNRERYNALGNLSRNEDEERMWQLCRKFWQDEQSQREGNGEYAINENLDEAMAQKYIKELTALLNKLGWAKE